MPLNATIYNEQVKLSASLINLVAVGIVAVGVTTPLVTLFYGNQLFAGTSAGTIVAGALYVLAAALALHGLALLVLRSLIE